MADEILWPLRAVSKDPTNLTKLDADNAVLTSTTDLDSRYVNVTGDTMTGPLAVQAGATFTAPATAINPNTALHVVREGGGALAEIYCLGAGTAALHFRRKNGTVAAPTPLVGNTNFGVIRWQVKPNNGAADRTAAQIAFANSSPETEDGYFDNAVSIGGSGYAAGQPAAALSLNASAANGRVGTLAVDSFVCAADKFTLGGGINSTFAVNVDGFASLKDGILVRRSRLGVAAQFETSNVGNGETGYGLQARCTGSSLTSGGVTGVLGESLGTCSVGVGVRGNATGTATANYGLQAFASGGTRNVGLYIGAELVAATGSYSIESQSGADVFFKGRLGLNFGAPTHQLEVGGDSTLRGPLEVVGNITSSGTAHSFASGSIPSPAVIGNIPRTIAATGSAGSSGQMVWDDNFIYLRTTGGWKKVALTAI